jgi:hypothetical protein
MDVSRRFVPDKTALWEMCFPVLPVRLSISFHPRSILIFVPLPWRLHPFSQTRSQVFQFIRTALLLRDCGPDRSRIFWLKMYFVTCLKVQKYFLSLNGKAQRTLQEITMPWIFKFNNYNIFHCCHYMYNVFLTVCLTFTNKLILFVA